MVTDPLPSTSITPDGLTRAAVSSSMPMPSSAGDWATSASSRPMRFRCSKCWSMITPGSSPRPALICVIRCLGVVPLVPKATMWVLMADAPALVPATIAPCLWRSMIARPSAVPPITLDRRSWLPPVMKMPVASVTRLDGSRLVGVVAGQRPQASHVGDAQPRGTADWYSSVASSPSEEAVEIDRHARIGSAGQRGEARQDLALSQLVLGAADDQQVPGAWRRARPFGRELGGMSRRSIPGAFHIGGEVAARRILAGWPPHADATHRGARLLRRARCRAVRHRAPSCAPPFAKRCCAITRIAATASTLATRRTAVLNRAWRELRDPLRRLHYDRALERGNAETLDWPLEPDEAPSLVRSRRRVRAARTEPPSRWHQPQWRNVAGFRVPAEVFMAGPSVQNAWIVANRITGEDWREHTRALLAALRVRLLPGPRPDRRLDRRARSAWWSWTAASTRWSSAICAPPTSATACTCVASASCARWPSGMPAGSGPAALGRARAARAAGRVPRPAGAARHG